MTVFSYPLRQRGRLYPLHVHIAYLFSLLLFVSCSVIGWYNFHQSRRIVLTAASDVFSRTARQTGDDLRRLYGPLETLVSLVAYHPLTEAKALSARLESLPMLREILSRNPRLSAIYVGYGDGAFFLVRSLANPLVGAALKAPAGARYLVQSVERGASGASKPTFIFYDESLRELLRQAPANYTFDPRSRPWYSSASQATEMVSTEPYVFFTTREVGMEREAGKDPRGQGVAEGFHDLWFREGIIAPEPSGVILALLGALLCLVGTRRPPSRRLFVVRGPHPACGPLAGSRGEMGLPLDARDVSRSGPAGIRSSGSAGRVQRMMAGPARWSSSPRPRRRNEGLRPSGKGSFQWCPMSDM